MRPAATILNTGGKYLPPIRVYATRVRAEALRTVRIVLIRYIVTTALIPPCIGYSRTSIAARLARLCSRGVGTRITTSVLAGIHRTGEHSYPPTMQMVQSCPGRTSAQKTV